MSDELKAFEAVIPCPTCLQIGLITQEKAGTLAKVQEQATMNWRRAQELRRRQQVTRAWVLSIGLVLTVLLGWGGTYLYSHLQSGWEWERTKAERCFTQTGLAKCSCLDSIAAEVAAEDQTDKRDSLVAYTSVSACYRDLAVELSKKQPQ